MFICVYTHIVYTKKLFVTIVFGHYKFKITVVLNIPSSVVKEKTPSYFSAIAEMLLVPNPWSSLFVIFLQAMIAFSMEFAKTSPSSILSIQ